MECTICGVKENLSKVKNEKGQIVYICESCYETVCEGYEKVEGGGKENGGIDK